MKRHKVTTACEACRSKKKKCDGQRPRCQACQNNNTVCNWSNFSGRSSNASKQYVQGLESKLRELEQHQMQYAQSNSSPRTSVVSSGPGYASHTFQLQDVLNNPITPASRQQQQPSPFEEPVTKGNDWLTTGNLGLNNASQQPLSTSIDAHLNQCRNFFGTASIGSFISQVVQSIDAENQPAEGNQPFSQTDTVRSMTTVRRPVDRSSVDYSLPTRKKADSLLSTYWTYIHTMFPFLDRAEIESAYRGLWTGDGIGTEEPVFQFILNMMFALSARLDPTIKPEERTNAAKMYLVRAQETLSFDIWGAGTFQSIQALLLLGQYYHTTDPHQSWLAVSMAVHTAQSLGLHLSETSECLKSIRARELMRRVWHGCVMMDRVLSQTYGRPPMISKRMASTVPPPLSIDDHDMDMDADQVARLPIRGPTVMEFFIRSLQLYELVAEILTHFYSNQPKGSRRTMVDYEYYLADPAEKSILYYENQLLKWFEGLPEYLKISGRRMDDDVLARQATILHQRYLHVRVLLLRPTLRFVVATSNSLRNQKAEFDNKKFHHLLMLQCAVTCVETAQSAIDLIASNGPPDPSAVGVISSWAYNILFLYTAATVLIAARLCPPVSYSIPETSISRSWDSALNLLSLYKPYGASANRALCMLSKLDEQIQGQYAKTRRNGHSSQQQQHQQNQHQHQQQSQQQQQHHHQQQGGPEHLTPASNAHPTPTSMLQDNSTSMTDPESRRMSDVQLDYFDPSTFNLEDFSWMDSTPFV